MPNFCECRLSVDGPRAEVERFIDACVGEVETDDGLVEQYISFDSLVPEPEDLEDGWYEWRLANWGTKWDANMLSWSAWEFSPIDDVNTSAYIDFDTAWSPPIAWLKTASALFPSLELTVQFEEPNMDFDGEVTYASGEPIGSSQEYIDEMAGTALGVERTMLDTYGLIPGR